MRKLGLCPLISAVFAFAATAVLLAEPAQADKAMFRMSYRFFGAMGTFTTGFQPNLSLPACGQGGTMGTVDTCGGLSVGATTPVAKFSIPPYVLQTYYTYSYTGYAGYTSLSTISSYNGRGRFQPQNPNAATPTMTTMGGNQSFRMVFPTTGGNPAKNVGSGIPVTSTTTFGGAFMPPQAPGRAGSVLISPGPNKFGGTLQFLYGPQALFKQKIRTLTGYYSKATGSFYCQATAGAGPGARNGPLQKCALTGTSKVGVIGSSGMVTRKKYTSLGYVPIKTTMNINDLTYKAYYLSTFAPWTTGMLYAQNPLNYKNQKFTATGSDQKFTGKGTTVTFTYTNYNTTPGGTTTTTSMQEVKGITRISSMVRPRLRHTYLKSNEPLGTISAIFQQARIWGVRVYFLPEPGGMLLVGAGILALASLTLLRRR